MFERIEGVADLLEGGGAIVAFGGGLGGGGLFLLFLRFLLIGETLFAERGFQPLELGGRHRVVL